MRTNLIDFERIKKAAVSSHLTIVQQLLPQGRIEGREYVALNPTRRDNNLGSFRFNCKSGKWADFATGDKGGDVISLWAYVKGVSQLDAAKALKQELGV